MRNSQNMDSLNRAAFDNFDDFEDDSFDDSYDDSYDDNYDQENNFAGPKKAGSQIRRSRPQVSGPIAVPSAEFNVSIVNAQAVAVPIELFNYQNSISKFSASVTGSTLSGYLPANAFSVTTVSVPGPSTSILGYMGMQITIAGVDSNNSVGFKSNGNLSYIRNVAGVTTECQVSCQETPYRSLFEYSGRGSFRITRMRLSVTNAGQLANSMTWASKSFLGKSTSQVMSVQSSKSPDQFQSLLVDLKKPFKIDAEKGLFYVVNAGETVTITMSVAEYVRSAI